MSNPRGDTQARILAYIEKATLQKGYPPSVREICDATGLKSTSTVHGHLIRLEKKGLLYRDSMKPRAISVPADHQMYRTEMVNVPILGRVTAVSYTHLDVYKRQAHARALLLAAQKWKNGG